MENNPEGFLLIKMSTNDRTFIPLTSMQLLTFHWLIQLLCEEDRHHLSHFLVEHITCR